MMHPTKVNDIFPTDPSLDHFWNRAKSQLPITDSNELYALLSIHHNTLLNSIRSETQESNHDKQN